MSEEERIAITNPDGTLKTKEEFMESVESVYNELVDSYKEELITEDGALGNLIIKSHEIEPENLMATANFLNREIYLTDDITHDTSTQVFNLIHFWNQIDRKDGIAPEDSEPIKIYIDTPGGDLDAVFSIIGSIQASDIPVYTYTIGTGYSGGFFIGIVGTYRYALPYSTFLFHEGCIMDGGDAHKFQQRTEFYESQLQTIKQIVLENTNIDEREYNEHRKDDWFFNTEEALDYGLIDEILECNEEECEYD